MWLDASYEEAASRLRVSMLCKAMVRPTSYTFRARIVELSHLLLESNVELGRVAEHVYVHEAIRLVVYRPPVHGHGLFEAVVPRERGDDIVQFLLVSQPKNQKKGAVYAENWVGKVPLLLEQKRCGFSRAGA